MLTKNKNSNKIILSMIVSSMLIFPFYNIKSESVEELNQMINEKKRMIDELNNQQKAYQSKIKQKQQEAVSLNNEISIINTKIVSREVSIKSVELQQQSLELEIRAINAEISKKENEIKLTKEGVKTSLQELYKKEDKNSALTALLLNENLSDFFDEVSRLKSLQSDLQSKIDNLQELKKWLETKDESLTQSKDELSKLQQQLEYEKDKLSEDQSVKITFLSRAENDEKKFNKLLSDLRKEQSEANNLINNYEQKARELLAKNKNLENSKDEVLSWPVPSRIVTSYFHDPDYPFRRVFEHPAVDLKAAQGTSVRAAASGYVAIAKDNGYGYNYIMIVHNNGLTTVYGHISKISVKAGDFVLQNEVIGLSGGMPGTLGAGRLTTGPHLHFEVRSSGTPINPLNYLK